MDTFQNFLSRVATKIGPKNAFDLGRDAQIGAFKDLLIKKGIATKQEIDAFSDVALNKLASQIEAMPPLPMQMQTKIAQ